MTKRKFSLSKNLQEGIAETINLTENSDGQFRDAAITLSRIEIDPDNPRQLVITLEDVLSGNNFENDPRKQKELEQLKELAATIEANGVLNPIVVYRFGEKYRIVAGERRYLASNLIKKHNIPARIYNNKPDALQLKIVQWVENTAREDLSLAEKLNNIESIIKFFTESSSIKSIDPQELSKITGLSLTSTYRFLLLVKSDQRLKQLIASEKLNSMQMAEILASIKDKDILSLAIEAFLAGSSLKEIQALAKGNQKKTDKRPQKKGRKISKISFGTTQNPKVAEIIIRAIAHSPFCQSMLDISNIDWNDIKNLNFVVKSIIKKIEDMVQHA